LPVTIEMPAIRSPVARASSAIARQSSGSVRALWPHAASVSIQSLPVNSTLSRAKVIGARSWSPLCQLTTGMARVPSRAAAETSAATATRLDATPGGLGGDSLSNLAVSTGPAQRVRGSASDLWNTVQ
jgi:hypothetical protein